MPKKTKTYSEINRRIKDGNAVVVDAEEMIALVDENGVEVAAGEVDVVTTATFGPMCSSGLMLNPGHTKPKIKMQKVWLNDVPAYTGIAAVDFYLGATEIREGYIPDNSQPSAFSYGGGHVIEDLVKGKEVTLRALSYGTDCYPRKELETQLTLDDFNDAYLLNPRNCYQNYNVAINCSNRTIYTYMGKLLPNQTNAHFSTTGQLSPLFNDPLYETIGIGSSVFVAGNRGFVYHEGTQHDPSVARRNGIPLGGAGTLALTADLKGMNPDFVRGVSLTGYGVSLALGVAIPIPVLNEDIARRTAVKNSDILAPVVDYSKDYGERKNSVLSMPSYEELFSGEIEVNGKKVRTSCMSSYNKALELAGLLGREIKKGDFTLTEPVKRLNGNNSSTPLDIKTKD